MRKLLLIIIACLVAMGGGEMTETAQAASKTRCIGIHQGINFYRSATHKWQQKLGHPITKSSKAPIRGCDYAAWVAKRWAKRAYAWRIRWQKHQAWLRRVGTAEGAIRYVFGEYANQALEVADCESGFYLYASNGQYQGMFQMGSSERATYGHGYSYLAQARAAWNYFDASGRDWSPWQCKPW